MFHRLTTQVGWPLLILAAVLLVAAVPALVAWVRFEIRLSRRIHQLRPRTREGWPYW